MKETERHNTAIEWTHLPGFRGETWNPVVGCTKVSRGCKHCYAETLHNRRHGAYKTGAKLPEQYREPFNHVQLLEERLEQLSRWRKPRAVFVNSLSDLFHEDVPDTFIAKVFTAMRGGREHVFQILTKRPERMRAFLDGCGNWEGWITHDGTPPASYGGSGIVVGDHDRWPLPNVWLGVSVEDQKAAETRIPLLAGTPAAVRFLSCEPLLGPLAFDITEEEGDEYGDGAVYWNMLTGERWMRDGIEKELNPTLPIHWVIAGAESGSGARPMDEAWVRGIRDACQDAQVPFFYKQNADKGRKLSVPELDGVRHTAFPPIESI